MTRNEHIKNYLSSLEETIKSQGDFRIYASKYVEDVKFLLDTWPAGAAQPIQKSSSPDVIVRKKKDS